MENQQEKMNKHERKEHLRQQRQNDYDDYQKKARQKKIALWVGGFVLLAVGAGVLFWAVSQEEKQRVDETGIVSPIVATDNTFGNPNSSVELIEYGDFECGYCARLHPPLKEVKPEYDDSVRFAYRHFLIPGHQYAKIAAYASEAAGLQGKFWEMHDMLFEKQDEWGNRDARDFFKQYAQEIGLDVEKFSDDMNSSVVRDAVEEDIRSGRAAGVSGTPTVFLNGERAPIDYSADGLRTILDQALQQTEGPQQQDDNEEETETDGTGSDEGEQDPVSEDTVDSDNETS